jgi:glycosyltransferase involved in cell wall biosynthesis
MSVGSGSPAVRPLITIGIACYEAEDTIRRAVESALAQTWTAREIVVVDDGSADGSGTVVEAIGRTHDEIRLIRHGKNRGVAEARNSVLAHARGTFIAFFDDDDKSTPDRLEQQYRRIVEYEQHHLGALVFCYSNRLVVPSDERESAFEHHGIGHVPPEPSGSIVADYVLGLVKDDDTHSWGMLGTCTLMARTETIRALGGFDGRFRRRAELDLAVRAAFAGAHFISVDAPLVAQYLTPTADKAGDVRLRYRLLLVEKHRRYLKGEKAYLGAWCNMHAQFYLYRGRRWSWRLWYLAALILFPWDVSRERLKHSPLLARLGLVPERVPSS